MKTLVLGLGNDIMSDDGAGPLIARELHRRIGAEDVDLAELSYAGWRFVDLLSAYEKVIIIDVIHDETRQPGECYQVELPDVPSLHLRTSHGMGFCEAMELARQSGMLKAGRVSIYAVTAKNVFEFGEQIDGNIQRNIPSIVDRILRNEQLVPKGGVENGYGAG